LSNIVGLFSDLRFETGAAKEMHIEAAPLAVEGAYWGDVKQLYRD
jgi:hypothetical protein